MLESRKGFLTATLAYVLWGLLPAYWKQLAHVDALQVVAHRMVWGALMLLGWLALRGRLFEFISRIRQPRVIRLHGLAALLISINWLVYVWAVSHERIVEASLGYFINPVFSVLLAVLILREKLRRLQWLAVLMAAFGMLTLVSQAEEIPWVALGLTFSFGFYGFVKKQAPLGSIEGLALETTLLLLPAGLWLGWLAINGNGALFSAASSQDLLLAGTGFVTISPLLLFAAGARRLPLYWLGMLQYLAPTLQLLVGVFVYHEAFGGRELPGWLLVWTALLLLAVESWQAGRRRKSTEETAG